jgi:hypothetical protein
MPRLSTTTPSITVTIGHETRLYFACVTTAPPALDSPNTITLDQGPFADIVGYAADPVTHDELLGRLPARLVIVDDAHRAWQEAKYLGHHELLLRADPWFAGCYALQRRLWQRLQARDISEVSV